MLTSNYTEVLLEINDACITKNENSPNKPLLISGFNSNGIFTNVLGAKS